MRRAFIGCVFVLLTALGAGGISIGPTPARGPDRTMSSELVVDGARTPVAPRAHRRTLAVMKPGRGEGDPSSKTFEVARTVAEVEELRDVWESLQGSRLASDLDYFLTCVGRTPGVVRPHVVLVEEEGEPAALVVAQVEETELPARLDYKTLFAPTMRTLKVVYGGILGPTDVEGTRAALAALHASLEDEGIELVRLRGLERGSPIHAAVTEDAPVLRRELFGRPTPHWRADVGCTFEEFLARRKKKVSWQAHRDAASLEETHGDELEVKVFRSRDELPQLFADTAAVHAKTYQSALGVGFSTDGTYKRQLGDESRLDEDVVVFGSSPKALSVNLVRNALQGTTTAARTVLERNGHLDAVKRAWRDRLRRSA